MGDIRVDESALIRGLGPQIRAVAPGDLYRGIARPGQEVMVIGDAAEAGKSWPAIASAFEAALLP